MSKVIYPELPLHHYPLNDDLFYLSENQIAIGIGFALMSKPCTMKLSYDGKNYERETTGNIPMELANDICSVQIYNLVEN